MAVAEEVLGTFHGSDAFPIEWEEGEKELFWIFDDLHCPNPVSPMFFDIGGWWLTCDHMFRRFGTPFACDWIAKEINGYVYTAAVPADSGIRSEATEYQARYVPRVPRDPGHAGVDRRLPRLGPARVRRQLPRLVARPPAARDRTQLRVPRRHRLRGRHDARDRGLPRGRDRRPRPPLEDPLDAELRPVRVDDQPQRGHRRGARRRGPGVDGPAAVEPRGPQLGLDRGPLEAQGARSRATPSCRPRSRATPPPTCCARSRAATPAAASSPRGSSRTSACSATRRSGRTSSRSRRGARTRRRSSRRSAATSRRTTTTRRTSPPSATTSRPPSAR